MSLSFYVFVFLCWTKPFVSSASPRGEQSLSLSWFFFVFVLLFVFLSLLFLFFVLGCNGFVFVLVLFSLFVFFVSAFLFVLCKQHPAQGCNGFVFVLVLSFFVPVFVILSLPFYLSCVNSTLPTPRDAMALSAIATTRMVVMALLRYGD